MDGDRDRARTELRASLTPLDEGVVQPIPIVTLGVIQPVVGPPALRARSGPPGNDLTQIQEITDLEVIHEGVVEGSRPSRRQEPLITLPQPPEMRDGIIELTPVLKTPTWFVMSIVISRRMAKALSSAETLPDASKAARPRASERTSPSPGKDSTMIPYCTSFAARLPARLPKTTVSRRELPPSRLAP